MAETLLLMIPAVGIAASPLPIAAVILMLMGDRNRSNSLLFLLGWIIGVTILSIVIFAVDIPITAQAATDIQYIKLAVGILLLVFALYKWRKRVKPNKKAPVPKWMASLERMHGYTAFAFGIGLVCLNPKDIALAFDGVTNIVQTNISLNQQLLVTALFIVVASSSIILPVLYHFAAGASVTKQLAAWKQWLIQHNNTIMIILLLLFGTKLIVDAF